MDSSSMENFEVVERDLTGRYVRYREVLGEGAWKTVYKGFDEVDGIEVAWSKVKLSEEVMNCKDQIKSLLEEAKLLKSLKHVNVMKCYHSWVDVEKKTINMITELFTSGDLSHYSKKHKHLDIKTVKNWARQILRGLDYLHSHSPPIVHRDIKCENIFVNGNSGKVKIGDLGLAAVLEQTRAQSVLGTPGFMAPELYNEDYNQLADIYSFGMCMLQMVTRELPYSECKNPIQIYNKVSMGIKPCALSKVTDPQVQQFIEKCLAPVSERPAAVELLEDPFLAASGDSGRATCSPSLTESVCSMASVFHSAEIDLKGLELPSSTHQDSGSHASVERERVIVSEMNTFRLHGKMAVKGAISMTLWIADSQGHTDKVEFSFSLQTDTTLSVIKEMAKELELSSKDAALIHELMAELIPELVPDYIFSVAEKKRSSSQIASFSDDDLRHQNMPQTSDGCLMDIISDDLLRFQFRIENISL